MDTRNEQEIAKTLGSFVDPQAATLDSGYGSEQMDQYGSADLPNTLDEKLTLLNEEEMNTTERTGEEKKLEEFIRDQIVPTFNVDIDGDTWLHILLAQRSLHDAQQIIYYCPDPNLLDITNKRDLSAMHISVLMDLEEEIKLLICKHARMDLVDSEGNNILHMCAEKGETQSLGAIVDMCMQLGRMSDVVALCNMTNYKGWTPFYTAVVHKNKHMCTLLVNKVDGIDVNAPDIKTGNSPLHEAVMAAGRSTDFVCFLLHECGIDVNFANKRNIVPLHIAAGRGEEAICAVLLECNARRDVEDDNGNVPAAYAANERIFQHLTA